MPKLADLATPCLVIDRKRLEANLEAMARRCRELGVKLRPHVKTHKCLEIGRRQLELGACGITVSTPAEAAIFSEHGFDDLTWAFPVVPARLPALAEIAARSRLGLVVESTAAVEALEASGRAWEVWVEVDCGYPRTGVDPQAPESVALVERVARHPALTFRGLLSHSGHAYGARDPQEVEAAAEEERSTLVAFAERLRGRGIEVPEVSVGSTPSMARVRNLRGATEARPGNYCFYDFGQVLLGSCTPADCALTVLATVISSRPEAGRCVVDAGALALSKDPGPAQIEHPPTFGEIFADPEAATLHPTLRIASLSQEHGVLTGALPVGERVRILPNHSCLTAALFDEYFVVEGDVVVDRWRVWRRRG